MCKINFILISIFSVIIISGCGSSKPPPTPPRPDPVVSTPIGNVGILSGDEASPMWCRTFGIKDENENNFKETTSWNY